MFEAAVPTAGRSSGLLGQVVSTDRGAGASGLAAVLLLAHRS